MKTLIQSRNHQSQDPMDNLSEATNQMIAATEGIATQKVSEAREQVILALDKSREAYEIARKKAGEAAKVADKYVHANPYKAAAVAFGVGALLALFFKRN